MDKETIKAFVQNTLGCGCPEEVFQQIACESMKHKDGIVLQKINIGNRLLVYVYPVTGAGSLQELIPRIVGIGKEERDRSGFNRFRLVLAADDREAIQKVAEELFKGIYNDDRVHLHILSKKTIPKF
jgi:hypothetical protein